MRKGGWQGGYQGGRPWSFPSRWAGRHTDTQTHTHTQNGRQAGRQTDAEGYGPGPPAEGPCIAPPRRASRRRLIVYLLCCCDGVRFAALLDCLGTHRSACAGGGVLAPLAVGASMPDDRATKAGAHHRGFDFAQAAP